MTESYKFEVENLTKHFPVNEGLLSTLLGQGSTAVQAVDDVSYGIKEGEALGLAGESGCGKTTLAKASIRLLDPSDGHIYFDGEEVSSIEGEELKAFRKEAQIIHQDPYESLNPRMTVRNWITEPLEIHGIGDREERDARALSILEEVGLKPAGTYIDQRPPDLSGGERQRVGIARALVLEPSLLVADEPASMLDVSIRADVLNLLNQLRDEYDLTSLYISHDLSLLRHMCDRIGIMYLGKLVEVGPVDRIIEDPKHPYTKALVSAIPEISPETTWDRIELSSEVPDPIDVPDQCRFYDRCPEATEECTKEEPPMFDVEPDRDVRCILYDE